ncbi:sugar transporter SWEET1 isoform X2 [Manduca sexta]|uniref:Sugar transporter SWEET1 n=1 Tax=Manduca sexta TaxID=7130 RepID=A0A922CLA8_MANSE|nr:sugar transporter SWEET1 isoform X2 [Manduca sexta]KAG6450034.1 hypothetical protein O3G_MSEX006368 [Manduca sexta]
MYSLEVREFVSNGAVLITILQFLSGIAGLWILYGSTKPDNKIIFVNVVGVLLMIGYIIVFYIYTIKKSSLVKIIIATAVCIFFLLWYVSLEEDNEILLSRLGLLACSLTLLTVAAPLSKFFYVLKVKCTDCLPFPMILMSFFVSAMWFFYGLLEEDVYITTPNFIGGSLAALQLSLFLIFPHKPVLQGSSKSILA